MDTIQKTREYCKKNNIPIMRTQMYFGRRNHDGFGFIDLVALQGGTIVAIQACGADDVAAHKRKILGKHRQEAFEWLRCGGKIEIWSWRKKKLKRGGKAYKWIHKVFPITKELLEKNNENSLD